MKISLILWLCDGSARSYLVVLFSIGHLDIFLFFREAKKPGDTDDDTKKRLSRHDQTRCLNLGLTMDKNQHEKEPSQGIRVFFEKRQRFWRCSRSCCQSLRKSTSNLSRYEWLDGFTITAEFENFYRRVSILCYSF